MNNLNEMSNGNKSNVNFYDFKRTRFIKRYKKPLEIILMNWFNRNNKMRNK